MGVGQYKVTRDYKIAEGSKGEEGGGGSLKLHEITRSLREVRGRKRGQ